MASTRREFKLLPLLEENDLEGFTDSGLLYNCLSVCQLDQPVILRNAFRV